LSFIHTRGVNYYYYYSTPDGKCTVNLGANFRLSMNQLHTADGVYFNGNRKEDHKLDEAFAHVLNQIWKV